MGFEGGMGGGGVVPPVGTRVLGRVGGGGTPIPAPAWLRLVTSSYRLRDKIHLNIVRFDTGPRSAGRGGGPKKKLIGVWPVRSGESMVCRFAARRFPGVAFGR